MEDTIGRVSFNIAVLNIFGKFLENISDRALIQHSYELSICARFSRNFSKIFGTAFSKNTAGGTLLISSDYSLKTFRTPFNFKRLVVTKGHTYLSKLSTKTFRFV